MDAEKAYLVLGKYAPCTHGGVHKIEAEGFLKCQDCDQVFQAEKREDFIRASDEFYQALHFLREKIEEKTSNYSKEISSMPDEPPSAYKIPRVISVSKILKITHPGLYKRLNGTIAWDLKWCMEDVNISPKRDNNGNVHFPIPLYEGRYWEEKEKAILVKAAEVAYISLLGRRAGREETSPLVLEITKCANQVKDRILGLIKK